MSEIEGKGLQDDQSQSAVAEGRALFALSEPQEGMARAAGMLLDFWHDQLGQMSIFKMILQINLPCRPDKAISPSMNSIKSSRLFAMVFCSSVGESFFRTWTRCGCYQSYSNS